MKPYFTMRQTIGRPVAEVFDTVIRLDEFPKWSPRNPSGKKLTDGAIGDGTRFELGIKRFGKVTMELREFVADKRVMVTPLSRIFEGGHRWSFSDDGDGGTRIDHELEMRVKGVFRPMAPLIKANGKKNLLDTTAALQRYLETTNP
jgi:Polyketide cyclase / dehydrase and lipid transport